jgi:DNA-binding transcriptional MocR family regulator
MKNTQRRGRLYDLVASRVASMIATGSLKPGERIPAIRRMSDQMSVAISTVLHAYQILEDRGLIEARPQSGFYVRPRHSRRVADALSPLEPEMLRLPLRASAAALRSKRGDDAQWLRTQTVGTSSSIALGMGLPSPEFLPIDTISKHLARAVRYEPAAAARYELSPGLKELRVRVAQRAMDCGCSLGPDEIVITSGATEALALALRAVTQPGDTVAVESPCYFGFLSLANMLSLKVVEVSTDPRAGISVGHLQKLLRHEQVDVKALLVNPNVHNPLGSVMPDEKKRQIAEMMSLAKIPIIEDDTYGDLAFQSPRPRSIKTFDTSGDCILLSSFSKTIAPGYRIGWIAAGRWHGRVNDFKCTSSLAAATPPQMAIASYLANGGFDSHLRRLRKTYRDQIRLMSDVVRTNFPRGTRATSPSGGHLLWVELPENVDADALHESLAAHKIKLLPGSMFSAGGHYRNCLRLNAAVSWNARTEKAVALIGRLAEEALRSRPSGPSTPVR